MFQSPQIGDLVRITLPDGVEIHPVELIEGDLIYISVGPGVSSILIPFEDEYQVKDLESEHRVEFLFTELTGDEFLDLLLLEELDDKSLETACQIGDYIQDLCEGDQLWKNKISSRYGQDKITKKPHDMTFKEYYYSLAPPPRLEGILADFRRFSFPETGLKLDYSDIKIKELARELGLSTLGNKAERVERIRARLQEYMD